MIMYERAKKGYREPLIKGRVVFMLPADLVEKFTTYCTDNDYLPYKLVECILVDFLNKYSIKNENSEKVFSAEVLELVPYNQSIARKELGFNEYCIGWYNTDNNNLLEFKKVANTKNFRKKNGYCSVPTYPQCFEWFRCKSKVSIDYYKKSGKNGTEVWVYFINGVISINTYDSYLNMGYACLSELLARFKPVDIKVPGRKVGRPRKSE